MEFKKFNNQIQQQFQNMCKTGKLFKSEITGNQIWDTYLASFKDEKVFRDPESSEHNCNCCKNFLRRYGNIVAIDSNGELITIFTGITDVGEYSDSAKACNSLLESSKIKDVFFETFRELDQNLNYESCKKSQETFRLGVKSNLKKYTQEEADKFGVVNTKDVYEFQHFNVQLPKNFVRFDGDSIEAIMAHYRDKYSVFKRAMEEIPLDTLNLVRDLINQGSLLDGTTHLHAIETILPFANTADHGVINQETWYWKVSYELDERIAKFKNTLIGVLCTELAEGMELNKACTNWNKRVDPVNYHKASAPITQKQINEAKKFVQENGYEESFNRRLATIDDIKASEILHMNAGDGKVAEVSIFDTVKSTSTRHKKSEFDKLEEVPIAKFMSDILPGCTSVEAYLENRMDGNLVTITKSISDKAKQITKWNGIANNLSWTFNGNLAGKSQIKEAVASKGGKIDGILRFSIMWAENDGDNSDLDAHCIEPNKHTIYYSDKKSHNTGGWLDVDITDPEDQMPKGAVENISYPSISKMDDGDYVFLVHQYGASNSKGFKAEIEFNGETYSYEYNKRVSGKIKVATINLKNNEFTINNHLPASESIKSKELWNLETNSFHKVDLVCKSPNHWGDNSVGNLHYMFMLDDCKTKSKTRGFHNENLIPELLKHKKVMEVLGNNAMIEPTNKQLSGLGFNSTVKDELIVKVKGSHKRTLKLKF